MSEPDYVVYCGTEVDLYFLGVPILDRGWEVESTQMSIADVIREAP